MPDIPPDIVADILCRLPAKSLLRFRCVSKPWRSLIDSKTFIDLHLNHSYKTNSNRTLIVKSDKIFLIDLDSFERLDIGNTPLDLQSVEGSCNGLVLLECGSDDVVLWNPSTRKLNKLPASPLDYSKLNEVKYYQKLYALGYDSKHDDYKVVRIFQASTEIDSGCVCAETKIYSLKSNSWKTVQEFPYMVPYGNIWGVYLNDAMHTVVKGTIMAFDLAKEVHYQVPNPKLNSKNRVLESVEVMGGFLTAVIWGKKNSSEIWVMNEYGVKGSWSKLLRFDPPIPEFYRNVYPLAYSKSGDEVLLNYEGMCLNWYDLKKKKVTIACVKGMTASFDAPDPDDPHPLCTDVCVGSLVSPYSPGAVVRENQNGNKGKEIKNKSDDFLSVGFKLVL